MTAPNNALIYNLKSIFSTTAANAAVNVTPPSFHVFKIFVLYLCVFPFVLITGFIAVAVAYADVAEFFVNRYAPHLYCCCYTFTRLCTTSPCGLC